MRPDGSLSDQHSRNSVVPFGLTQAEPLLASEASTENPPFVSPDTVVKFAKCKNFF